MRSKKMGTMIKSTFFILFSLRWVFGFGKFLPLLLACTDASPITLFCGTQGYLR
jgi:hypothetical protein